MEEKSLLYLILAWQMVILLWVAKKGDKVERCLMNGFFIVLAAFYFLMCFLTKNK